jgi:hypothetical protein
LIDALPAIAISVGLAKGHTRMHVIRGGASRHVSALVGDCR